MNEFFTHPSWKAFTALFGKAGELVPHVGFMWPSFLWGLLLIPIAVVAYVLLLRRRKQGAMLYGAMALVKQAMAVNNWRRHVPPALMLGALALLLAAMARPTAEVTLPSNRATVILAIDVSGSMRSSDVTPSRIEAAQTAAKAYIKDQPKDVQIGIVAFAGSAMLVQNPTTDHVSLDSAIDRFELQRGTAVGSGILVSLQTLFPQEEFPINNFSSARGGQGGLGNLDRGRLGGGRALGDRRAGPPKKEHVPVEPGSYKNAVVILLTDGATNAGYNPVEAARIASNYGVKVYTVAFGTTRGAIVGFGGYSMRAQIDEDSLKKIADMTRARYFHASSAEDLKAVYGVLSKQLIMETKEMEITSLFSAIAALLMLTAAGLSVAWFGRVL